MAYLKATIHVPFATHKKPLRTCVHVSLLQCTDTFLDQTMETSPSDQTVHVSHCIRYQSYTIYIVVLRVTFQYGNTSLVGP